MYPDTLRTRGSYLWIPVFVMLTLLSASFTSQAQWIRTNGPKGGHVNVLFADGANIFAGTPDGAYFSSNLGVSWTISDSIFSSGLHTLSCLTAVKTQGGGKILYAGTSNGVFISSDDGSSWQQINSVLLNTNILSIASLPNDSGNVNILASTGGDLLLSTNGGLTWTHADSSLTDRGVGVLAVSSGGVKSVTIYAGTAIGRVFASYDSGTTWSLIDSETAGNAVVSIAAADTNIFIGTADGFFRSTNGGTSWVKSDSGLENSYVSLLALDGDTLYGGTGSGLFRSSDNGKFWSPYSNGLWNTSITAFSVDSGGSGGAGMIIGTGSGVFHSGVDSANWVSIGLPVSGVYSLSASGRGLWAGTDGGIFLSTDYGASWKNVDSGSGPIYAVSALSDSILLIANSTNSIFRSTDGGASWLPVNFSLTGINGSFAEGPTELYEASSAGLLGSGDSGKTWSQNLLFGGVTTACVNDTTILAGTESDGIYRSTDNCLTWTSSGLQNVVIENIVSATSTSGRVNFFAATGTQGIFKSTDDGVSWDPSGLQSTAPYSFSLYVVPKRGGGSNLFASTLYGGTYVSTDNGTSWAAADSGMGRSASNLVRTFALESNNLDSLYLFAGSVGVWRRPLSQMVAAVNLSNAILPARFSLGQNYPNPFNPTTKIQFSIARRSGVRIAVYDVLGREVSLLVNGVRAPGTYTVSLDGSRFASGVYFCRMISGTFSEVKKLVLIK